MSAQQQQEHVLDKTENGQPQEPGLQGGGPSLPADLRVLLAEYRLCVRDALDAETYSTRAQRKRAYDAEEKARAALDARLLALCETIEAVRQVEQHFFDACEFEIAGRIHQAIAARSPEPAPMPTHLPTLRTEP